MQFPVGRLLLGVVLALGMAGCSHLSREPANAAGKSPALQSALEALKVKYAPEEHLGVYRVGVQSAGHRLVLTGEVDNAEAKLQTLEAARRAGLKVEGRLEVLPASQLGQTVWGIACLSVASGREQPEHKAEMGTQVLMGGVVRVLKPGTNSLWYYVQSADGYLTWLEKGTFVRCTAEQVAAWQHEPLLIVTAFEDQILEQPQPGAQPVSDVVIADLVKKVGEEGDWYKVELPDRRSGFLLKTSAEDYTTWQQKRHATGDSLERTARRFLGRPYLWGGNSPKGLDCSGFTKLVYYLNGVELSRNSGYQAQQGVAVPLDADLSKLKKGDLLFFGRPARGGRPERVRHVAMYLGNKLFIQSSERVQINSLDPASPLRDELRIRTLLSARRILAE